MKVGSLFSGGGLGDYGLELAGMEIVFQVEIDEYCQKILQLRWPDVPKWKDIRDVKGKDLPYCDMLSGGFPCQDISTAGNRKGITGERSGLWKEYLRLIREIQPRYVFVENVSALLVRGIGTVLGDLAESRYDAEWECIPASAIGAPHQRDRIWILAYSNDSDGSSESRKQQSERPQILNGGCERELADTDSTRKSQSQRGIENIGGRISDSGEDVADTESMGWKKRPDEEGDSRKRRPSDIVSNRSQSCRKETMAHAKSAGQSCCFNRQGKVELRRSYTRNRTCEGGIWTVEPSVGRVANGVANRVDRLKLLGNGQVVQVVQWIGERIMEYERQRTLERV